MFVAVATLAVAGLVPALAASAPSLAAATTTISTSWTPIDATHDGGSDGLGTPDGGIFTFGKARFSGPAGSLHFNKPVVDIALPNGPAAASVSVGSSSLDTIGAGDAGGGAADPVSIRALAPSSGTAGGGDTIDISGRGFTDATEVDFGNNTSSDFEVTSATSITAVAPVGVGTVNVEVVTPAGTSSVSSASRFAYIPTGQRPITRRGQHLDIGGVSTLFTGYNAFELATHWGTNAGCGGMATIAQIDAFFASLRPHSLVRFWAFQGSIATNVNTGQLDWQPLDNVFYAAAMYHVYLIPVISDQGGGCDGYHWQDPAWYSGGFRDVFNTPVSLYGSGLDPLSYWNYMKAIVSRYADSPALGMWEPMSEAEASTCPAAVEPTNCGGHQTCPSHRVAASALKHFFTTVGAQIHLLDHEHLVEGGFLGGGQCGTSGRDYKSVGASPGIDVLSVHDYYGTAPFGGDQFERHGGALRPGQGPRQAHHHR